MTFLSKSGLNGLATKMRRSQREACVIPAKAGIHRLHRIQADALSLPPRQTINRYYLMNEKPPHSNAYSASCLRLKLKHPVCRPAGVKTFYYYQKNKFIKPLTRA